MYDELSTDLSKLGDTADTTFLNPVRVKDMVRHLVIKGILVQRNKRNFQMRRISFSQVYLEYDQVLTQRFIHLPLNVTSENVQQLSEKVWA